MKTEPFMNWLSFNFPTTPTLFEDKKDCIVYYWFDANEVNRVQRRSTIMAANGYKTDFPIALWDKKYFRYFPDYIVRPNSYDVFKHANCIGCLKAGWQHWYCVYVLNPDIYKKGILSENKIGYSINKDAYLEDKIELFERMIKAGIEPTEKIKSQTLWAMVKKILKEPIEIDEAELKPCECYL